MDTTATLKSADLCVKCGLCLPHCPTYLLTRNEAESPRGRIALIQGLAEGALEAGPRLVAHLDHCLMCRACEKVCPSMVPFGALMDTARTDLAANRRPGLQARLGKSLLSHPDVRRVLARALRFYQRSGLSLLATRSGLVDLFGLGRQQFLLPEVPAQIDLQSYYPASAAQRGDVALFKGCIAENLDTITLQAAVRLLNRIGFGVHVPATQTCCGALHQHNGDPDTAAAMSETNLRAFGAIEVEAIITTASGCGAQLAEYPLSTGYNDAGHPGWKVMDISRFLVEHWPDDLQPAAQSGRVAVHDPCSLTHILPGRDAVYALLGKIPQLEVLTLPGGNHCCGAAGSYCLTQPEMANALRAPLLDRIRDCAPDMLVTSNIGCGMHIAAGLRAAGNTLPVMHPIHLLDAALRHTDGAS